jgi:tetratricopeptide (TPR) repeat protein
MSTSPTSTKAFRIGLVVVCLGVALAGALLVRRFEAVSAKPAVAQAQNAVGNPEQILASIPATPGDSLTDQAVAHARARAKQNPRNPLPWVTLGDSLMQKARDASDETFYDPAEAAYNYALQLNPKLVGAMNGIAWVKGDRHLFDESIAWGKKAIAADPGNAAAYGILGDAALQLGDYNEAFEDYQKMADLRPDISSYSRGAYLLWVTGKRQDAFLLMQKAIRAGAPYAENTAWCRSRLALMLFNDGAYLPAEQVLAPAVIAAPRNVQVLLAAGRIKIALHDNEAAKDFYRQALEVAPNVEALGALGDLAAAEGAPEEAEKFYRQVDELHAQHMAKRGHDHLQVARFYAEHDRNLVEALRLAEERKLTRNVFEADTLALVYYKNGQVDQAQEAIGRALSQNTPDPAIQFHAGMIAAQTGDRVAAQKYLGTALSWSPLFSLLDAAVAKRTLDELGSHPALAAAPTASVQP